MALCLRGSIVLNLDDGQEEGVKYTYDKHLSKTKMRRFPIIPQDSLSLAVPTQR